MDKQSNSTTAESGAPHELSVFEKLRRGHGLLSPRQFAVALRDNEMEVWSVGPDCFVLIALGQSMHGSTVNILTALGDMRYADECMINIERMARKNNARAIMSVGRLGWEDVAKRQGYTVERVILMKKVLE